MNTAGGLLTMLMVYGGALGLGLLLFGEGSSAGAFGAIIGTACMTWIISNSKT